ncbi:hypothetical protein HDV05_004954, partial [Chytridiales sp. JEL 0842]
MSPHPLLSLLTIVCLKAAIVTATLTLDSTTNIKNYDFPGFRKEYNVNQPITLATFTGNNCQLAPVNKTTPGGILFISVTSAREAGCTKYSDIPASNSWYTPCRPTDIDCLNASWDVALIAQITVSPFCCTDPMMFRFTAQYNLIKEGRFQDSRTVMTGISPEDAKLIVPLIQSKAAVTINNVGAIDQGTELLHSTFVKAYSILRIVIIFGIIIFEVVSSVYIIRKDGFAFNLKWGVLATLALWSLCLIIEYSIFSLYSLSKGFPYSPTDTSLTTTLHWGSFLLGYVAFSMMLLAWANVVKSISLRENKLIRALRTYFPYATMLGMVVISISVLTLLVHIIFNLPNILAVTQNVATLVVVNLVIQVLGYSYYCFRILQHTRAKTASISNERGNDMSKKLTLLAIAVIGGWILLGVALVLQNYVAGSASYLGFWSYNIGQDVCFFFVILSTFASLNMRFADRGSSGGNSAESGGGTLNKPKPGFSNIKNISAPSPATPTTPNGPSYNTNGNYSPTSPLKMSTMGPVSRYQNQLSEMENGNSNRNSLTPNNGYTARLTTKVNYPPLSPSGARNSYTTIYANNSASRGYSTQLHGNNQGYVDLNSSVQG